MGAVPLDINDVETVSCEKKAERFYRVVENMLVVNLIEIFELERVEQVGVFEDKVSVAFEAQMDALDDFLKVVNVRKAVVAGDQIRGARQSGNDLPVEEAVYNLTASGPGALTQVGCRLDALHLQTKVLERFQKHPIVGADIDGKAPLWNLQLFDKMPRIALEVPLNGS